MLLFWIAVNIAVTVFLIVAVRQFLLTFCLVVDFVLLVQPAIIEVLFGVVHPKHGLEPEVYETALAFIALYNLIVGISFQFFQKSIPMFGVTKRYFATNAIDRQVHPAPVVLSSLVLICVALAAKLSLHSLGQFLMMDEREQSPFVQLLKVLGSFDVCLLIFLGEFKMARSQGTKALNMLYVAVAVVALGLAFLSGSRFQVLIILIIAAISHRALIRQHLAMVGAGVIFALPTLFVIFPLLGFYRRNEYNLNATIEQLDSVWDESNAVMMDVITTRLNYLEPVAQVLNYTDKFGPAGGTVYLNNFLALIPRLVWHDKPVIENNATSLGQMLGLAAADDWTTAIGLRAIGEAYIELAWLGLLVAVVQGLTFAIFHKQLAYPQSPVFYAIYINLAIFFASHDAYFAVLPGLVYFVAGWVLFLAIMSLFLPRSHAESARPVRSFRQQRRTAAP
jgi:hypothetical protein